MQEWGLAGCFLICFLSATIVPFPSEAAVLYFIYSGYEPLMVLFVASLGNTLGGLTNYALGYFGRKLLRKKERQKGENWINRFGIWSALFSWLPFVGDPILILLGYYKTNFWKVAFLSAFGKTLRYLLLIYGFATPG